MKRKHTLAQLVRWKGKAAPEVVEAVVEVLRELDRVRAERDHARSACVTAEWKLRCSADEDARSAVAERKAERAAVVAWLRWVAGDTREWSEVADVYDTIADNIERGEHSREEEGS